MVQGFSEKWHETLIIQLTYGPNVEEMPEARYSLEEGASEAEARSSCQNR